MKISKKHKTAVLNPEIKFEYLSAIQLEGSSYLRLMPMEALNALIITSGCSEQVIVGASLHGRAIGVAFSSRYIQKIENFAQLLWLYVDPGFRHQCIGKQLLLLLEEELIHRNIEEIQMRMKQPAGNLLPIPEDINNCLKSVGWTGFLPFTIESRGEMSRLASLPWLKRGKMFEGFSLFLWKDLKEKDRLHILKRKKEENWYPDVFGPFDLEKHMVPFNSLGLRRGSEVVGWIITHFTNPKTISYSDCFISPELQYTGIAVPLIVEAVKIHLTHPEVPLGTVMSHASNMPMVNFIEKRIQPYMNMTEVEFMAYKKIIKPK